MIGKQLGSYRIIAPIGAGTLGTVYLAEHPALGFKLAVKRFSDDIAGDRVLRQRVVTAARAAARCRHAHLITVFDLIDEEAHLALATELAEGESLAARWKDDPEPPSPAALWLWLAPVLDAVAHAHGQGLTHGALHPGNILLAQLGGHTVAKVTDLGFVASLAPADRPDADGDAPAWLHYAAPEQLTTDAVLTPAADIYALGAVIFEALTGTRPYHETDRHALADAVRSRPAPWIRSVRPGLSHAVEDVIARALSRTPAARWPDCHALGAALDAALTARARATAQAPMTAQAPRTAQAPMEARAPMAAPMPTAAPAPAPAPTVAPAPTPAPAAIVAPAPTAVTVPVTSPVPLAAPISSAAPIPVTVPTPLPAPAPAPAPAPTTAPAPALAPAPAPGLTTAPAPSPTAAPAPTTAPDRTTAPTALPEPAPSADGERALLVAQHPALQSRTAPSYRSPAAAPHGATALARPPRQAHPGSGAQPAPGGPRPPLGNRARRGALRDDPVLAAMEPRSTSRDKWIIAGTVAACLLALLVAMIVALSSGDRTSKPSGPADGNTNAKAGGNDNTTTGPTPTPRPDAGVAKNVTCETLRGNWTGVFYAGASRLRHDFIGTVHGTISACRATFRITTSQQGYVIQDFDVTISGSTITFRGTRVDRSMSPYGYSKDTFVGYLDLSRVRFSGRVRDTKGVVGTVTMQKR